ncbi:MAG: hypothetical protein ACO1SX_22520 [Actinomycetota bacterium]
MTEPPGNSSKASEPDPRQILHEARQLAGMGRHAEALEKHLWFHHHALEHRPSLYGVRLSYALRDWLQLGAVYPPALEALKKERDACADRVRSGEGDRLVFNDFKAINRTLGEDGLTREMFVWLDIHLPIRAAEVMDLALPALLKAQEYSLCGRYLAPEVTLQGLRRVLRARTEFAQDREVPPTFEASSLRNFATDAATLVALLVINERKIEVERIAAQALLDYDTPEFRDLLEKAKGGEVPKQRR